MANDRDGRRLVRATNMHSKATRAREAMHQPTARLPHPFHTLHTCAESVSPEELSRNSTGRIGREYGQPHRVWVDDTQRATEGVLGGCWRLLYVLEAHALERGRPKRRRTLQRQWYVECLPCGVVVVEQQRHLCQHLSREDAASTCGGGWWQARTDVTDQLHQSHQLHVIRALPCCRRQ